MERSVHEGKGIAGSGVSRCAIRGEADPAAASSILWAWRKTGRRAVEHREVSGQRTLVTYVSCRERCPCEGAAKEDPR
jgi:hypothetical protein